MSLALSTLAKDLIDGGAIAGGTTALGIAVTLTIGGIAQQAGKDVNPWQLATERGATLGACAGVVIALVEIVPWK